MIIKIDSYNQEDDYRMYDGIEKYVLKKKRKSPKYDQLTYHDILILDMEKICDCKEGDECSKCVDYYTMICKKTNGDEVSIVFDTIAYIMNNDGKTIEKIVANYND